MHRAFVTWLNSLPSNHPARSLAVTATLTFHTSTQTFHVYLDESQAEPRRFTTLAALRFFFLLEAKKRLPAPPPASPAPRYDDVFAKGLEALNGA